MIYDIIPFGQEQHAKNYGAACNEMISHLPDNCHIMIRDYDTMFLNHNYMEILTKIVNKFPNDLITCRTNRVGNRNQCFKKTISEDTNILNHANIANSLAKEPISVVNGGAVISGMMMLFPKKLWKQVGGFKDGILSVDNDFSRKVVRHGHKVWIVNNVYLLHYYRFLQGKGNTTHLKREI